MGLGFFTIFHRNLPLIMYITAIVMGVLTIFRKVEYGFYYLILILPFGYVVSKIQRYPFGNQLFDFLFVVIIIGAILQGKRYENTISTIPILLFIGITSIGLVNGHFYSNSGMVIDHWRRLRNFKNYLIMISYYFLVTGCIKNKKIIKNIIYIIIFLVIIINWRFWDAFRWKSLSSTFRDNLREGAMGYLGTNDLAAFIAQYTAIAISLFLNYKKKILFLLAITTSVYTVLFCYSRGGYIAFIGVILFFSMFKKKFFISLIIFLLLFSSVALKFIPSSVIARIEMTKTETGELESSAESRIELWKHGWNIFKKNPIFGSGFETFGYIPNSEGKYRGDPHNRYVETLSEFGLIGLILFLYLLYSSFKSGWLLYKSSDDYFFKSFGLGFCGCVIACSIANLFGDRWSYMQTMSYFWIIWGLVDSSIKYHYDTIKNND